MSGPANLQSLCERYPLHMSPWEGEGRQAGVLVALTEAEQPRVILGRRARHLSLHPGEIAFPGGKRESADRGPWDTALREAREEVGLLPALVTPLAELPPQVTRTSYRLFPCVGRVPEQLALQAAPEEFDSLLLPPLQDFAEAGRFHLKPMEHRGATYQVPHYQHGDDLIWGVTAVVLAMIANLVYDAGLDVPPYGVPS